MAESDNGRPKANSSLRVHCVRISGPSSPSAMKTKYTRNMSPRSTATAAKSPMMVLMSAPSAAGITREAKRLR